MNLGEHLASRKLAVDKVAAKAGLLPERLVQIAGGADASLAEMRAIAKSLRLPLETLLDSEPAEPVKALFRHTLGQREVEASSEVEVVSAQVRDALTIGRGLPGNTAWLDLFRGMESKFEAAEEFAQLFRKAFAGLDDKEPFPNLPQVAHELGVFVLYSRDPAIEGVSAIVEGYALMVLGARAFKPRMLFTMAHEFGHLVAHHDDRASGYAHFDRQEDFDGIPSTPRKHEEKFADAFGSALILPRHGVLLAVKAIREQLGAKGPLGDIEILWLAHLFHVSFEVAARRCEGLGLVPPRGARALYQKLQDEHKNPERRAADLGIPARPDIAVETSPALLQAAARKVRAGDISVGRAAELLNVPVSALFVANAEIAV
ncbi:ImmA/IrrE family metallo-endopeptidase [Rhizobacter sp. J219]|uniref:ImmA/IrrE family metallo-endopeptidase n=1 Tax=Rhizobacter sp. J219 TaxID=2898430 RepID=UPI002150BAB6|nr:ImmA/IrrE family metallo-endopeptidase [Rhizobacter sp. J219]MCR5883735.1 ImmA/IrrE family metallo-endopeptidase [Rhizobacter sp. J219]